MHEATLERVRGANARLRAWLVCARESLAGRRNLMLEDLRAVAQPIAEMQPVVFQADELRASAPELRGELETYAQNLGELETTLERVRFALLARCAQAEAERAHLETVGLWAAAWRQTQPGNLT